MTLLRLTNGFVYPECNFDMKSSNGYGKFDCLAYKFDSPANCETKEKAEINDCEKYQFFCQSDLNQSPIKVCSRKSIEKRTGILRKKNKTQLLRSETKLIDLKRKKFVKTKNQL